MPIYDDFYDAVIATQTAAQQDAAERARISQMQSAAANVAATTKQVPVKVTVKPGDTLSEIAAKNKVSLKEVLELNPKFQTNPKYDGGRTIWSGTKVNVGYKNKTVTPPITTPTPTPTDTSTATPTDTSTSTSTDTSTSTSTDTSTSTSTDTTTATSTVTATATATVTTTTTATNTTTVYNSDSNTDAAANAAVLEQIAALTKQIADMQAAAAAESAKPKVTGTRTVRKTGGVVEVYQQMSDGSLGNLIESYKDFGAKDSVMKMFENT